MTRCHEKQEANESAESSEVRRRRPERWRFCGRWGKKNDGVEERESAAGQRNRSGMKASGDGEEWGCVGGVEEKETCSDKRLFPLGCHDQIFTQL